VGDIGNRIEADYGQVPMRRGDGLDHGRCGEPVARTLRLGLIAALVLFSLQSAIGLIAALGFNSYHSLLDLDRNNGIPDLFSTAAILMAAVGAAELAIARKGEHWKATALTLLLSIVALADLSQQEAGFGDAGGVIVVLALVTSTLLILAIARNAPRRVRLTLVLGLCLLVVAVRMAYEYDQFLNLLGRGDQERGDLDYELGIVLKQGLEFLGWSFVAVGIWATAVAARVGRPQIESDLAPSVPRSHATRSQAQAR
jgi:hypothetical protein